MGRKKYLGRWGYCPKCEDWKQLTRHHIVPKRFFGWQREPIVILLCRDCHDELEKIIPISEKQERSFYSLVVINFLDLPLPLGKSPEHYLKHVAHQINLASRQKTEEIRGIILYGLRFSSQEERIVG